MKQNRIKWIQTGKKMKYITSKNRVEQNGAKFYTGEQTRKKRKEKNR